MEPWSSGYGRRLVFKCHGFESPNQKTLICRKKCFVCIIRPKINKKTPWMVHSKNNKPITKTLPREALKLFIKTWAILSRGVIGQRPDLSFLQIEHAHC